MNTIDNSHHLCLICSTTIVGLLQYVEHFKSHAIPEHVVSYQQDEKPSVTPQLKRESEQTSHETDDGYGLGKPIPSEETSHCLSNATSSQVYYDETSPLSAFANQEFPDPDMETDALLSPKYNIDFFQSLELKSINEETTVPASKSKLKATQRLSILEDDIHAENLLPITSILSNLDFSSDEDDVVCSSGTHSHPSRNWSDEDENENPSRTHPPRHHTGGKWKPGQGPGKSQASISAASSTSSSTTFQKKLPIAGKWKPSSSLGPASRKAIMKGNKKKLRGPMADVDMEFACNVCGDQFPDRTSYSFHFGEQKHKEAVAERRQTKKVHENSTAEIPEEVGEIVTESGVAEAVVAVSNVQPKVHDITANVDTSLALRDRGGDQYQCPVCNLYFSSSFVFQTHCETKLHKDRLLSQGYREYRSSDGVIIRVDVRTDTIFTDRQENQLMAAKQPKKLGPTINIDGEKHECTVCRKVFKRKYEMARHLLTRMHRVRAQNNPLEGWMEMLHKYNKYMTRLSLFQCGVCQFYFNRQHDFLDHMCSQQHIKSCADMLGPIMCVACKYKTHQHEEMMKHLQSIEHYRAVEKSHGLCIVRESHTSITCKFCGIQMHSAARIKRHCLLRHANRLTDVQEELDVKLSERALHKCPMCDKVFKVKTLLQFHFLKFHRQTSFFTCTVCNRGFLDQRRLDNHLRTRYHAKRVIQAKVQHRRQGYKRRRQEEQERKREQAASAKSEGVGDDEDNESTQIEKDINITEESTDKKSKVDHSTDGLKKSEESPNSKASSERKGIVVDSNDQNVKSSDGETETPVPKNVRRSSRKRKKIKFVYDSTDPEDEEEEKEAGSVCVDAKLTDHNIIMSEESGKGVMHADSETESKEETNIDELLLMECEEKSTNIDQLLLMECEEKSTNIDQLLLMECEENSAIKDVDCAERVCKTKIRDTSMIEEHVIDKEALERASKSVFSCTYCDFSATDMVGLRSHYNEMHPCEILMCQQCNQFFLSLKAYKIHCTGRGHQLRLREQSGETEMHACPMCDKRFLQASFLALHVETVHRHPNSEVDLQRIHKGSDLVTQLYGDHVAQVEKLSNDTSVSCPECGKFIRKDTLIEHLRLHTGEKPYTCRFCNKSFAGRLSLRRHISSHLDMPLFICDLCGKEFKRNSHLVKHMVQHDNEKRGVKFMCSVCKVSFFSEEELERHKKRHAEKKYRCTWPGCQWYFVNPSELKAHMHTHTKERTYLCDQCGYGAPSKARLKRHSKTHDNLRPFACDHCPYKASLRTHLVRHMRIHSDSKPFACPYCNFTCNTHENIRKHILKTQKHIGKKLYPCKLCTDFGCNSSSEFKGHLMTVHADYLRENAIDSLSLFSGLYKKENDFTKPKEGCEIKQVTKGRFFKKYTNQGVEPEEKKTQKTNASSEKKGKKSKSKAAPPKPKVVVVSQEELMSQVLEPVSLTPQQSLIGNQLRPSLLSATSQSHQQTSVEQTITLGPGHSAMNQIVQQQQSSSSTPTILQLQLEGTDGALEMAVAEQEEETVTSTIEIPHYIEIPNMVIQDSLAATAEGPSSHTDISNGSNNQRVFPVTLTISSSASQLDEQLIQQHQLPLPPPPQQHHQLHDDLQLQQHLQQLQQQQHQQHQQHESTSTHDNSRVFWVDAATTESHHTLAAATSLDNNNTPSSIISIAHASSNSPTTNADSWYTGMPQVLASSCQEIASLADSLQVVPHSNNNNNGDNNITITSSIGGHSHSVEPTSTATVTEFLPDKYFNVTATQIYNSVSGDSKVVVLDQPASDI